MRSEIASVEGLSLGNATSFALLQSTYSVLSFPEDSQKARSAASLANLGIGFKRFFIDFPLSSARSPSRNRANQPAVSTLGKCDMQTAIGISPAQCVIPGFLLAMFHVGSYNQRLVKKSLFNLGFGYAMFLVLT
jgi:hypothetical protein